MSSKREIILDVETTGLSPHFGDRIIEIACIEVIDGVYDSTTDKTKFHTLINPECAVPASSTKIHGITDEDLKNKPVFASVAKPLKNFISDSIIVAHNASFDMGFLENELKLAGLDSVLTNEVVDTLNLAKKKYPSGPNSLDALCERFGLSLRERKLHGHGALIDVILLQQVYDILLHGKQQRSLYLQDNLANKHTTQPKRTDFSTRQVSPQTISEAQARRHQDMLSKIKNNLY